MGNMDIGQTSVSDLTNTMSNYEVSKAQTDGTQGLKETEWRNLEWEEQLGLYKNTRSIRNVIDALARWTIGKGYLTNPITELTLLKIRGHGKDSFNGILKNLKKVMEIGGDAFAEIIRDKKGYLVNLKPLDPGTIAIVCNQKGIITKYKQYSKIGSDKVIRTFKPDEIFHLSRNRIADEIHGISLVSTLKWIVTAQEEAMRDYKKLLHRNVCPIRVWHLDTDDTTKIAEFKSKVESMKENFEDIFIPMGAVETEISSVPSNVILDPKPWIKDLDNYFYESAGVPKIIVGNSSEFTEAAGKIVYLSFEQTVEEGQLEIEEQVLAQLNLEINLEFPASLRNEVLTGMSKSETMQAATKEDTTAKPVGGLG